MTATNSDGRLTKHQISALIAIVISHIALRIIGLLNHPRFDDHDSLAFIANAKIFLSGDAEQIWGMNPDAIPLYPLLAAIVGLITGDLEMATRIVSLLASVATLCCLFVLTKRIAGIWPAIVAAGLLAINPTYIRWSYGILTEPLYVALVTAGLVVFFAHYRQISLRHGILLGVIFGLAFLTRLEGILFVVAIPLLLVVNRTLGNSSNSWSEIGASSMSFVVVFVLLAAPQVIRVSDNMNTFSLNGRTTWSVILNTPDDRSYADKIYGLHYDDGTTNLIYLQSNPEATTQAAVTDDTFSLIQGYAKTVLINIEELHHSVLPRLIGLPAIAFAMYGLLAFFLRREYSDALMLTAFLGIGVAGPLLHNVNPRHIAVLVPMLMLLTAAGIDQLLESVKRSNSWISAHRAIASAALAAFCLSPLVLDLGRVLILPDERNNEYSLEVLEMAIDTYEADLDARGKEPQNIVARKSYFGHFADVETILMPHTDLQGLLRFMQLNNAEYLFLVERLAADYPFVSTLEDGLHDAPLTLLFEHASPRGGHVYLYRRDQMPDNNATEPADMQ